MSLKGKRVFIVEDDAGGLAVASHYLREAGALVLYRNRGEGVAEEIKKYLPVHLVLMDLMLPAQVSGFDVFAQLHSDPALSEIPVIAVSSMDPDLAMPRAKEMGFAGFIAKPLSPNILRHVQSVLDGKKVWVGDSRG